MKLCFATNNKHKLEEVAVAVRDQFNVQSLEELSVFDELPETHDTLEENAIEKAEYVFNKTGIPCFADDSGLEVEALGGAPGVYSARYAGPQRNSEDNMNLLQQELRSVSNRNARFRTVIALVGFTKEPQVFEGVIHGKIIDERRGTHGFGYDPIFLPEGCNLTFAEMTAEQKSHLSHRARAVSQLVHYLKTLKLQS